MRYSQQVEAVADMTRCATMPPFSSIAHLREAEQQKALDSAYAQAHQSSLEIQNLIGEQGQCGLTSADKSRFLGFLSDRLKVFRGLCRTWPGRVHEWRLQHTPQSLPHRGRELLEAEHQRLRVGPHAE